MGVECAVSFCLHPVNETILSDWFRKFNLAQDIYLLIGRGQQSSGMRSYFSVYSSGDLDLRNLCAELSCSLNTIYTCWRADHSALIGYTLHKDGIELEYEIIEGPHVTLFEKFEKAFSAPLALSDDMARVFPELLFDEFIECWKFDLIAKKLVLLPHASIKALMENTLNVELVMPV